MQQLTNQAIYTPCVINKSNDDNNNKAILRPLMPDHPDIRLTSVVISLGNEVPQGIK